MVFSFFKHRIRQSMILKKCLIYFSNCMNAPHKMIKSSQTLYEAELANLNMYYKTGEESFLKESIHIGNLIIESQLPDGGFDIGYNFYFGDNLKKSNNKQSTTPEVLSIYALIELYKVYKKENILQSIQKGVAWIKKNAFKISDDIWAISYAPDSIDYVNITNAVSFCVGTLANYLAEIDPGDSEIMIIYQGMCKYMLQELTVDIKSDKGYWTYFEKRLLEREGIYNKIDNYHIAQQLYYHIQAQKKVPNESNEQIIKYVKKYLIDRSKENLYVPYMEFDKPYRKIENIDLWGYCALLLCFVQTDERELADQVGNLIVEKGWNGQYFYPIINNKGEVLDNNYYPRSDAWVLHAFSEYYLSMSSEKVYPILVRGLERLKMCNYCGAENHALTKKKKFLMGLVKIYKKILR